MFPYIYIPTYKFGPFTFQAFGLLAAIGVILGTIIIRRRAEKMKLDVDLVIDSFFVVLPGAFIISHLTSVLLYFPQRVIKDPMTLIYVWEGISSFGGILGGLLLAFFFYKKHNKPLLAYMEATGYGFLPGFTIGRFACAVAHDHPGMWLKKGMTGADIGIGKMGVLSLPTWESPSLWITVLILGFLLGTVIALFQEKPIFSGMTVSVTGIFVLLFGVFYPYLPAFIRSLTVSWPKGALPHKPLLIWAGGSISSVQKYDLGLIEALFYVLLFTLLWVTMNFGKPKRFGFSIAVWFILYAPVRFFLDYLRIVDRRYSINGFWAYIGKIKADVSYQTIHDYIMLKSDSSFFHQGWTPGQYLSALTLFFGFFIIMKMPKQRWNQFDEASYPELPKAKKKKKKVEVTEEEEKVEESKTEDKVAEEDEATKESKSEEKS